MDIERIKSINIEYIKSFNDDNLFQQFQEYLKFYSDIKIAPEIILKIKQSVIFKNNASSLKNIYNNTDIFLIITNEQGISICTK